MISDINFLLVGNSRLHWAKYSQNQSKFFHTQKDQKVPENIDLDNLSLEVEVLQSELSPARMEAKYGKLWETNKESD